MFNSKYSKVLTGVLIVAVIAIVGLLVYIGIDWYKAYVANADNKDFIDEFDGYTKNNIGNTNKNTEKNTQTNDTNIIEPIIDPENVVGNTTGNGNSGSSGSSKNPLKYKGFDVAGKIEIPKTGVNYIVLKDSSPKAIEVAIGTLYGPGINEVGNTVLIGHNYRNGTFFSNNSKLSNGDKIYLTDNSGRKITYEIYRKYQTDANDFSYAVRDTKGKREVSLSTCTTNTSIRLVIWAREK